MGSAVKTEAIGTGAPSHAEKMWLQANWGLIQEGVKRLQARIAKATMEGRWGKVGFYAQTAEFSVSMNCSNLLPFRMIWQ
jgi:hypothetical protein